MTELKEEKKTGLVLEGGGMRGIYTAGVLDVFLDHDRRLGGGSAWGFVCVGAEGAEHPLL